MSTIMELRGKEIAPLVHGAMRLIETPRGLKPVRLPAAAECQVPNDMVRQIFYNTTGVRLRFSTTATTIEIDCALGTVGSELAGQLPFTPTFELEVDGSIVAREKARHWQELTYRKPIFDQRFVSASERVDDRIRFDDLPTGRKQVQVWLPPYATTEIFAIRGDAEITPWHDHRPRWVHYGSSISHGAMGSNASAAWPAIAAHIADMNLTNLGVAGECHLDQFVARGIRDANFDYISIKAGINVLVVDSMKDRTLRTAVHGFLDTVRDGHPVTPIVLASPTYCAFAEEYPGPFIIDGPDKPATVDQSKVPPYGALTQRHIRDVIKEAIDARSDPNLHYLDGLDLLGAADAHLLVDGLHPGPRGTDLMGRRFAEMVFGSGGPLRAAPASSSPHRQCGWV